MPASDPDELGVVFVRDRRGLEEMLQALADVAWVGVDLEGDGLYRYRARLCLLQVASLDRIWIVDTLAIWDVPLFSALLGVNGPQKIMHDAAFDARLLRENGVALGHVYDTSVAARFLGERNTGLATLLRDRLGQVVGKELQKADWGKRPLEPQALNYLADDVRHLFALAASLRSDAQRLQIDEAIETETLHVLAKAQIEPTSQPAWLRVKGVRELLPVAQGVVRELVELRERAAMQRDVPPFKVCADASILDVALAAPADVQALGRVKGAYGIVSSLSAAAVLDAIEAGKRRPPKAEDLAPPAPPPSREQRALERAREKALSRWRREQAEARGVDPQVVLPGHCLSDLAALRAVSMDDLEQVAGLGRFRVLRDGEALLRVLRDAVVDGDDRAAPS